MKYQFESRRRYNGASRVWEKQRSKLPYPEQDSVEYCSNGRIKSGKQPGRSLISLNMDALCPVVSGINGAK
ncbi:hypothetical protein QR685DRAFT_452823 [Neurospora intermedia]|uniref:Uncharacterized protein n=1 Tax=Neurospora intermedia TaxID=5142 RepID=A0ABR3D1P1_NEUIN